MEWSLFKVRTNYVDFSSKGRETFCDRLNDGIYIHGIKIVVKNFISIWKIE